ncbi:hypothetical protein F6455_18595 [Proteobacteria bacterium 005FR1]|nr:hypothetical protein [Proteobacteria bacterium 005FR1]
MNMFKNKQLLAVGLPVSLLVSGGAFAQNEETKGFWGDDFNISYSGFVGYETAVKLTSDENPYNQRGNPFNEIAVAREDLFGNTDVVTRPLDMADNDFNMSILRGKFDLDMRLTNKLSFRAEVRGIYELDPYENFELDRVPGADPAGELQREPNFFEYLVSDSDGDLQDLEAPGALEWAGEDYFVDLPRFYLDYQDGALLVRAGNQQIAWGQSLFFRVMDIPNGLDLRRHSVLDYVPEEFSDKRVPSLALRVQYMINNWELDSFVQHFRPTIYSNPNTPYNTIASQFTVHDLYEEVDDEANFGLRVRGDIGAVTVQAMATRRYGTEGTFRWTKSGVNKSLTGAPGDNTGALMAETAFERDPTGVLSAEEWFTYAGLARLDGVEGLNASINEFEAAQALGAVPVDSEELAKRELDTFFMLSGGLRGHIAREYHRENVYGLGLGYTFSGAPGSILDQLIANIEIQYADDRHFTNPSLSRDHIVEDEWIGSLVLERWHRFSRNFPATYIVLQYMYRSESDIFGRHLSGMGGTLNRAAGNTREPGNANYIALAVQQPSPSLEWRFDFALLYDTEGGYLFQPAVRWRPGGAWGVEAFANIIDGDVNDRTPNFNALSTAEWADEFTLRLSYSF